MLLLLLPLLLLQLLLLLLLCLIKPASVAVASVVVAVVACVVQMSVVVIVVVLCPSKHTAKVVVACSFSWINHCTEPRRACEMLNLQCNVKDSIGEPILKDSYPWQRWKASEISAKPWNEWDSKSRQGGKCSA